ncbi:hypothetical protein RBSWK_02875 [Rhodopirellula baltica SWK14]|uniref:Uncharacterized protein n=1 Tax=Rhodopirellula baltica SWK14 TaxID=993516 RepID=L7CFM5_RHOBT|nr:hypothetical protein RBSWK_02875 [Rhodopirellula baltica SWK14]
MLSADRRNSLDNISFLKNRELQWLLGCTGSVEQLCGGAID